MADIIKVPDFKNIQEFEAWAYKLEDKKIQSWTTKDWLQMYEKLDKIPTPRTEAEHELLKDALIKLNRNYRLEEADFKTMQEIGKKIGQNLAKQNMDFDLASVNIDNSLMEGAREQFAQAADKAVYETSQYAKAKNTPLGDYNRVASEISISEADKVDYIGVAREVNEYSSEISLSNTVKKDVFGSTAIHESVHAQLQTLRTGQQEALTKLGLKPEEGFSDDFYKLLQYNDKYYVENTTDSRIYSDLEIKLQEGTITQQEFEKLKKAEILKGSAKQPLETQAQIIGLTAEHYYRQETGQLSERAARAVTDVMGKPQLAQYNKKGEINLSYRVENKEAFDKKLSSLVKGKAGNIATVYDEKRKIYTLTVSSKTTEQEFEKIINSVTSKEMTTVYDGIDINNMGKARPDLDNHIMTPAEQRKNLAFYARAAKEHVGWEGFSEENKRLFQEKIVETYKSISGDCKQAEFMERVAEQTAPFIEDRHFTLATGSKTYLGGISEKSSVGRNIANYSSEEMANLNLNLLDEKVRVNQQGTKEVMWRICTTKVNGEDMLIVSIPQLPNSGDYNASKEFIETFDKIYFDHKEKWDKGRIILDVRGNLGGEDKPIDHMAKRLYGNSVNTYKRCEIKDTEISNAFLHRHGAYKPNNLQRDGINPEDIVQRKHFSGENKVLFDETGTFYPYNAEKGYHGRIDVLLDRKVSSSAESAYTSFYHHPMVRFIGEHTAGMQQFTQGSFAMPCGYMMRVGVTKLDYWDKEGENIEIKGHKPDIECKGTDAFSVALEKGRDEARVMGIRQSNEPRKGKPVFVEYDPKAPTDPRKAYYARYLEPALAKVETKNKTTVELEHMATKEAQSAEKTVTKTALRAQAKSTVKQVGNAATNVVKATGNMALKANAKFDAAVDKVIDKGTKKLNNSTVGKAYQKAATKVADSKTGKAVAQKTAKVTQKVVQKVAANSAGKAVGKVVTKTAASAVGKSVLKKIPLVSAGAGAYFAYKRLKDGELKAAGCELLSGIAGCFPGVGTAASVAIDVGLATNDIHNVVKESKNQTAQTTPKVQTQPQKKVAPKDLSKQIAQRAETKKKTTQKTTVTSNQVVQAKQNSRA